LELTLTQTPATQVSALYWSTVLQLSKDDDMNLIKPFLNPLALILILTIGSTSYAQQRRNTRTPRRPPAPANPQRIDATFDTLLAAGRYKVYAEIRNVGQVIKSSSVNELLEPVMKLAAPSKEFKTLVEWLNVHAEQVTTSRLMVSAWPTAQNVPDVLVVLEFDSPEAAAKFSPQLDSFLPKVWPRPTPDPDEAAEEQEIEANLKFLKNNQYKFIYVLRRNDGEPFTPDDNSFLRAHAPQVSDWVKFADRRKVIAGTNVELSGSKFELIREQFVVKNYSAKTDTGAESSLTESTTPSGYQLQQVNSLILISPTAFSLKNLRPSGSKLLSDNPSFRIARSRFISEQAFIYFDINEASNEVETRTKQRDANEAQVKEDAKSASEDTFLVTEEVRNPLPTPGPPEASPEASPAPTPDPLEASLSEAANSFFRSEANWPDAFAFGMSFENDSLDVKALMVNRPGEKSDFIPLFPNLIPSAPLVPESPLILPADTELFVMFSLDLPQIYAAITKPTVASRPETTAAKPPLSPFTEIESRLKISIKDDLLPLLGSEIAVSMPMKMLEGWPLRAKGPTPPPSPDSGNVQLTPGESSFVAALSLKDKEGMKVLLPQIIDSIGFKGASAFAQKERREDTEIISYGNMFSYAIVANFLVISVDSNAIRHVVDSYLNHETLSSETQFKNSTRWQPQQLQAQVYVSPALMKSYNAWVDQQSAIMSDQLREFLSSVTLVAQPITYSLSSDGLGTLHELHVPKNLVLMAVAGASAESNPSPLVANERSAITSLYAIANAENRFRMEKGSGSFGTLEQLQAEGLISEQTAEPTGYKLNLSLVGARFELTATPAEHGKTGKISYFIDETSLLRGADHSGGIATSTDPPID
jgi:Protein of unknown function (DUF3352)